MKNKMSQKSGWISIEDQKPSTEEKVLVLQQTITDKGSYIFNIVIAYYLANWKDRRVKGFYSALLVESFYGEWGGGEYTITFPFNSIAPEKVKILSNVTHWSPLPEIEKHHLLKIKK